MELVSGVTGLPFSPMSMSGAWEWRYIQIRKSKENLGKDGVAHYKS